MDNGCVFTVVQSIVIRTIGAIRGRNSPGFDLGNVRFSRPFMIPTITDTVGRELSPVTGERRRNAVMLPGTMITCDLVRLSLPDV